MNYKTPKVIPAFVLGMVLAPVLHATTIVVDNRTPQAVPAGSWSAATAATDHFGTVSDYVLSGGATANTMTYTPDLPAAGTYQVEAWNSCYSPRATDVPHTISHAGGTTQVLLDRTPPPEPVLTG